MFFTSGAGFPFPVRPCGPNYADKHHPLHRPALHKGVVLKFNANQRYATTALTAAVVREVARRGNVPLQTFAVGNDTPCGSTIGPISATRASPSLCMAGLPICVHSTRKSSGWSQKDLETAHAMWKYFHIPPPAILKRDTKSTNNLSGPAGL